MQPDDFPKGYQALHELGEGSMGTVWLAWHQELRGHCAIKILSLNDDRRGSAERSFNREVRAMARLEHPSVIQVHDYGRTPGGSPYVAIEYVEGTALNSYSRSAWGWAKLWTFIDGLLAGLGHAHSRGFIHRDLKPGNVLIQSNVFGPQAVKLLDFGIAIAVTDTAEASRRIEGTPAYIAPEAAKGDVGAIGPWTDLYSLGVILFEIVTGDLPFHGRHLLDHHQRSPLPTIEVRPAVEVPSGLVPIIERLLEKSPVRRYRSVAELRAALSELGPPPNPIHIGTPPSLFAWDDDEDSSSAIIPLKGAVGPALVHLRNPPIVGRKAAQIIMQHAADMVLAENGPRVLLIEGEAGLGKSRLAGWLRESLDEAGSMSTLKIQSEPQVRTGGGLKQAVMRLIGDPTASPQQAEKSLRTAFSSQDAATNAIEVLWRDEPNGSETRIRKAAQLIRDVAGDRPFLLWADDAQWSPEGRVLRLIHRLARAKESQNMLLVVTLRPSQRTTVRSARRALRNLSCTDFIRLSPIPPLELAPALEALAPIPSGLATAACIQAAGNPLLALEVVRAHLEAEGMGSAPSDPGLMLQQRIQHATQGEQGGALRSMLARATLLGRSFTLRPLLHLCGISGDPDAPSLSENTEIVARLLERAVSAGLIIEQGPKRWRFSHDLVRGQLRQMCRKLANWPALNLASAKLKARRASADATGIELEVVARHYWEAGEHLIAFRLAMDGVQRLHAGGLMGHATSFSRRILEWDDGRQTLSAKDRCALRLMASDAAEHSGQPDQAQRHAAAAVDLARRNYLPALGARAASRMGILHLHADQSDEAETWMWDALRFARQSEDPQAQSNAQLSLGQLYQHGGQLELALTAYEASLECALFGDLIREALEARMALAGLDRIEMRLDRAFETLENIIEAATEAGFEVLALTARLELGLCAWVADDPLTARAAFNEVRSGARGNLFLLEFYACLGEAWAMAVEGRWNDAEMALMHAEELRWDVRLRDIEAERLRVSVRELALAACRPDIVRRIDHLHVTSSRTFSTHDTRVTTDR